VAKVLLVEPYDAGSHRSWAVGVATHSAHDVRLVTHAGGFWKWRMHGAAVTLARSVEAVVQDWGPPDVLLVSDMVNVAALVGLARRSLGDAAVVLYLHENQLTYPLPEGTVRDEGYAMANWVSMCAADVVACNSEHHRSELFGALPGFLRRFPDHRHSSLIDEVAARAVVLPVGIDPSLFALERIDDGGAPVVLWNHRWEYDKGPAAFFAAMDEVERAGVDFRLAVAGQSYQTVPPEFEEARRRFADRLVHFGTAPDEEYRRLLARADVVVSTARHDFFGLAAAEAMAAGALPILPLRLSYPELVAPDLAGRCLYPDGELPTTALVHALADRVGRQRDAAITRRHVERFAWPNLIGAYDELLEAAASRRAPAPS
jgi:glycosyltransferase involved in cell wall biosynthesis